MILREINFGEFRVWNIGTFTSMYIWGSEFWWFYRPGQSIWGFWLRTFHTVWKISKLLQTLILREINFGWCQKVNDCCFDIFGGFEFLIFEKNYTWKCQKFPKNQNSELLKWSKKQFLGLLSDQNWFHAKSEWQKIF